MTTTTKLFTVPAGTPAGKCRGPSCGAVIYWIRINGVPMPVDCEPGNVTGCRRPSETKDTSQRDMFSSNGTAAVYDGKGISHFANCPDAELFRRRDQ
jgi:hypothetical protein